MEASPERIRDHLRRPLPGGRDLLAKTAGNTVNEIVPHQALRVLDGAYVLDRTADTTEAVAQAGVLAIVLGPDGSMVIRRDDTSEGSWSALWNGDEAHEVEATGMLSAIVTPLAADGIPVWVASSYDGDIVLVPASRLDEATEVLQAAGHFVSQPNR